MGVIRHNRSFFVSFVAVFRERLLVLVITGELGFPKPSSFFAHCHTMEGSAVISL